MSFQAYLDNIQAKTGKTPADFRAWGKQHGFGEGAGLAPGVKAGEIVAALKDLSGRQKRLVEITRDIVTGRTQ